MSLLKASFDYLTFHLALKYVDDLYPGNDYSDLDKLNLFNRGNDFGLKKISLYPFMVTIGNGNRAYLLEHYQKKFIPLSFGIVQKDIFHSLKNNDWPNCIIDYSSTSCQFLRINELVDENEALHIIAACHNVDFEQLENISEKIKESIEFINRQKIKNFASCNLDTLTYWSTSGLVFNVYKEFYEDDKVDTKEINLSSFITTLFNQSIEQAQFSLAFG